VITLTLSKIIPIKLMVLCLKNNREWIPNNRKEIKTCLESISLGLLPLLICNSISPPMKCVITINLFKPRASHRNNDQQVAQCCHRRQILLWKTNLKWGIINNDWHQMLSISFRKMTSLSYLRISNRFSTSKRCFPPKGHPLITMLNLRKELITSLHLLVFIKPSKTLGSSIWCLRHLYLAKIQLVDLEICHLSRIKSE
jgi:hypothetical protein